MALWDNNVVWDTIRKFFTWNDSQNEKGSLSNSFESLPWLGYSECLAMLYCYTLSYNLFKVNQSIALDLCQIHVPCDIYTICVWPKDMMTSRSWSFWKIMISSENVFNMVIKQVNFLRKSWILSLFFHPHKDSNLHQDKD